jgi:hypothetical protein
MNTARRHMTTGGLAAIGITLGLGAVAVLPASMAAAAGKTVQIGNNTAVTVAPGWTASTPKGGKLGLTHTSPQAVVEIAAGAGETGTVDSNRTTNVNGFMTGFGMKQVKVSAPQAAQIPGSGKFNELSSVTYTGKYQGQKLGGVAVEYQNTTTGDGAFAIVVAKQSDKSKLRTAVNQMFQSIATNP